jgi:phosphotransacetylase
MSKPIAVAAANSILVLESARASQESGYFDPILIGDVAAIQRHADTMEWDLAGCRLVEAADESMCAATSVSLVRAREASAIMKGDLHTDVLLSAVLDKAGGLRTGRRLSHIYGVSVPHSPRFFLITDSGVNVAPDVATKVDIVRNAVDLAHALGNRKPRVAVLSAIEKPTAKIPSSIEARMVMELVMARPRLLY